MSNARSPIPWFGGKQRLAKKLAELLPPHGVYVEVFGGGASVLFTKSRSLLEVYNDVDEGLVNFFRVLRDRPEQLVPKLIFTPYSRAEFATCRGTWNEPDIDEVERARRWWVIVSQSFAGHSVRDDGTLGRCWGGERLGRLHLARGESTANRVDYIWHFVDRLRGVQIESLDWRDLLERYDGPDALFYLDPPYVPETRRSGSYAHELTENDHVDLVERVLALSGQAIVSGYSHDLYAPLETGGFERHEFKARATAAKMTTDQERHARVEVVWTKSVAAPSLFAESAA